MVIVPDLNMLLYAYNDGSPEYQAARRWWEGLMDGEEEVGLAWIVVAGFLRQVTHPSIVDKPMDVMSAMEVVDQWFELPHVTVLNPGSEHLKLFRRCLETVGTGGNLVTDSHIAAIAMEYGAVVHTNDRDFSRFPGLSWHNPLRAAKV